MTERTLFIEDDDEESEDDDSSKLTFESLLEPKADEVKEKATQSLGSLAGSLFERQKPEPEPKLTEKEPDHNESSELTPAEEAAVYSKIAEDHLKTPVVESPEEPVTDFLEEVADTGQADAAYESVLEKNQLEPKGEPEPALETNTVRPESTELPAPTAPEAPTVVPALPTTEEEPIRQPEPQTVESPTLTKEAPSIAVRPVVETPKAEAKTETSKPSKLPAAIAAGVSTYIAGRRETKPAPEKPSREQKEIKKQIKNIARDLENKEQTLQDLSRGKRANERSSAEPAERTQPGLKESRLGLTKPERAEHLGKVVVSALPPVKTEKLPKIVKPEQVKTMPRQELLGLSEDIIVEGASLRRMYENSLFGEGALRRLVAEHLKGREISSLLRQEILERQIDFERDPRLRDDNKADHGLRSLGASGLLDKMLSSINKGLTKPAKLKPTLVNQTLTTIAPKPIRRLPKTVINIAYVVVVVGLIVLIIYLLLRH